MNNEYLRDKPRPSGHMIARGRELREHSTNAEMMLWNALRGRRVGGLKFRRQHTVGPYVVDFICTSAPVIIELDGDSHLGKENFDRLRQEYLESEGFKVLRFRNEQLKADPEGVLREIAAACGVEGFPPSPGPSDRPLPRRER